MSDPLLLSVFLSLGIVGLLLGVAEGLEMERARGARCLQASCGGARKESAWQATCPFAPRVGVIAGQSSARKRWRGDEERGVTEFDFDLAVSFSSLFAHRYAHARGGIHIGIHMDDGPGAPSVDASDKQTRGEAVRKCRSNGQARDRLGAQHCAVVVGKRENDERDGELPRVEVVADAREAPLSRCCFGVEGACGVEFVVEDAKLLLHVLSGAAGSFAR